MGSAMILLVVEFPVGVGLHVVAPNLQLGIADIFADFGGAAAGT